MCIRDSLHTARVEQALCTALPALGVLLRDAQPALARLELHLHLPHPLPVRLQLRARLLQLLLQRGDARVRLLLALLERGEVFAQAAQLVDLVEQLGVLRLARGRFRALGTLLRELGAGRLERLCGTLARLPLAALLLLAQLELQLCLLYTSDAADE